MAGLTNGISGSKKRIGAQSPGPQSSRKRRVLAEDRNDDLPGQIARLEKEIHGPERNVKNIELISSLFDLDNPDAAVNTQVALSLCRVFSRSLSDGLLSRSVAQPSDQRHAKWLLHRLAEYYKALVRLVRDGGSSVQVAALRLFMQVLKEDGQYHHIWRSETFSSLLNAILDAENGEAVGQAYMSEYMGKCCDCMYFTLEFLRDHASAQRAEDSSLDDIVTMMSSLGPPPSTLDDLLPYFLSKKWQKITPNALKRHAEVAWLSVLSSPAITETLRKQLLRQCTTDILPWMARPESLMDFLTSSYNVGGSTSLLAISGLFTLISSKNLDYPSFYPKLYSLLDADLLHSKHRSRFFRLLQTFLASTHLPATLVASFIKRLCRLALFAPPAAIVAIVPYVYNLLKTHPTCTFMIHRPLHPPYTSSTENLGTDPFDMSEPNPQLTHAIDSSLWELETLQSHYHPNVAAIARIISEQFTKQQYIVEDFLDHSYTSMIDSELRKEGKKAPVVEWKFPKRILTKPPEDASAEEKSNLSLLQQLWAFD